MPERAEKLNFNYGGDDDTFRHKTEVLQNHCLEVGRDFDEITLSRNLDCVIAAPEVLNSKPNRCW